MPVRLTECELLHKARQQETFSRESGTSDFQEETP